MEQNASRSLLHYFFYTLNNGYCSGTHGKDSSTTKMYNINKQPENGVKAYYVHTYTYKSECREKSFHSKHHRAPNTSDTYTQDALNFPFGQRTETKFICKHKNKLPLKCRKKWLKALCCCRCVYFTPFYFVIDKNEQL